MHLKNSLERYGVVAQLFHWTIVVLIVTQFVLANKAGNLPLGAAKIATLAQHKSVGMTIFGLAILRLIWRWLNPVPPLPPGTPGWQRVAAHASHWALYGLLLIIPLFGWLMSSARNFSVSWFGIFTFPDLIAPNRPRYEFFHDAHEALATVLFCVAILHIAAALKHHLINRDNVLRRMLPVKLKPESR
jgi:cytochrome b561